MQISTIAFLLGLVASSPITASPVPLDQAVAVRDTVAPFEVRSVEAPLEVRSVEAPLEVRKGPAPSRTIQSGGRLHGARDVAEDDETDFHSPLSVSRPLRAAPGPSSQIHSKNPIGARGQARTSGETDINY